MQFEKIVFSFVAIASTILNADTIKISKIVDGNEEILYKKEITKNFSDTFNNCGIKYTTTKSVEKTPNGLVPTMVEKNENCTSTISAVKSGNSYFVNFDLVYDPEVKEIGTVYGYKVFGIEKKHFSGNSILNIGSTGDVIQHINHKHNSVYKIFVDK